jgi:membrane protease YdiL (CAAX protease family)
MPGAAQAQLGAYLAHPAAVLAITALLFLAHFFWGSERFFARRLLPLLARGRRRPDLDRVQSLGVYYRRASAFLLYGMVPLLGVRLMPGESLRDFGLSPHLDLSPLYLLPLVVLSFFTLLFSSRSAVLHRRYPEVRTAAGSGRRFLLSSLSYLLYFFGYEFLFRGFLLFGLYRHLGAWKAVLASTAFTALTHLRTPLPVILGSVATGLLFARVVLAAGSLWPVLALHCCIGIGMDLLCIRASARSLLAGS